MVKRYPQVVQQLLAKVADGTYPVGSTLPSEPLLAESLGVSRSTVRVALGEMQAMGMVSRRRSLGTKVEADRPVSEASGFSLNLEDVEAISQYAAATRRDALEEAEVVVDVRLARQLGVPPGSRWLRISYRRIEPQETTPPICWTDVYVREDCANAVMGKVADHRGAIVELIETGTGRRVTGVEQRLCAVAMPEALATPLAAKTGDPSLEIIRRYYLPGNDLVEVSVSLHPGDRFAYFTRMARG